MDDEQIADFGMAGDREAVHGSESDCGEGPGLGGSEIKTLQHRLYEERLRKIESGEISSSPFSPRSDFGELVHASILTKRLKL